MRGGCVFPFLRERASSPGWGSHPVYATRQAELAPERSLQAVTGLTRADVAAGGRLHLDDGGVKAAERITELKPERIVYISCNPSTFAREAAVFSKQGYGMRRLTLIDQFPNTYHIETVALLSR